MDQKQGRLETEKQLAEERSARKSAEDRNTELVRSLDASNREMQAMLEDRRKADDEHRRMVNLLSQERADREAAEKKVEAGFLRINLQEARLEELRRLVDDGHSAEEEREMAEAHKRLGAMNVLCAQAMKNCKDSMQQWHRLCLDLLKHAATLLTHSDSAQRSDRTEATTHSECAAALMASGLAGAAMPSAWVACAAPGIHLCVGSFILPDLVLIGYTQDHMITLTTTEPSQLAMGQVTPLSE